MKAIVLLAFSGIILLSAGSQPKPYPLRYPANFGGRYVVPADNPTTVEGVYLGRMLFYERKLSAGNSISCASCHQQSLAFTDGKKFSQGFDKTLTSRNSISLANLLWVRNLFWDGRASSLEAQAIFPLTDAHEMGQPLKVSAEKLRADMNYRQLFAKAFGSDSISETNIVRAISQFERTLISADSNYDRFLSGNYQPTAGEMNGMKLFQTAPVPEKGIRGANCEHCHGGVKTIKELFHNNGLDTIATDRGRENFTQEASDRGRFRVPTLRNIALTAPYMHDGRFTTLEEVLDHYNEHIRSSPTLSAFLVDISNDPHSKNLGLTTQEKKDIVSFLHMLTDSTFITNPAFSDPHQTSKLP
jgi:cytochrome c peroxidase